MAERNKATEKPPSFGEKLEHSKFVLVLMLLMVLAVSLIVMIIPENDADIHFVAGQYSPYTLFSRSSRKPRHRSRSIFRISLRNCGNTETRKTKGQNICRLREIPQKTLRRG